MNKKITHKKNSSTAGVSSLQAAKNRVAIPDNRPQTVTQKKQVQDMKPKETLQQKANKTGLPDHLKSGIENLSGVSMDSVKVHYNSSSPAQLNAHAYAQGTDIHIAPGQEKHLPHEAWHVVQQAQGRVKPTKQMKGQLSINDDKALEKEADTMGGKALQLKKPEKKAPGIPQQLKSKTTSSSINSTTTAQKKPVEFSLTANMTGKDGYPGNSNSSKIIQRNVVVGLNALMPPTINAVTVTRFGMTSLFANTWGDHTTPFVLFRALFRNRLTGLSLNAAVPVLNAIHGEILALPGFVNLGNAPLWAQGIVNGANVNVNAQSLIANAALGAGPVTIAMINNYASALLSLRNVIPLSAVEFGGVGHGEGHWQTQMQVLNNELAAGLPFNAARQQRLRRYAKKLIDRDAFGEFNQGVILPVDQDIAPGLTPNLLVNSTRMANQHVQSIESAYPSIRAALLANGPARVNLIAYLRNRL